MNMADITEYELRQDLAVDRRVRVQIAEAP